MPGRWLLRSGRQPTAAEPVGPARRPAARHHRRICAPATGQSMKSAQTNTRPGRMAARINITFRAWSCS